MKVYPANNYLIEIQGWVAGMPVDRYIQWASLSHDDTRFYVWRGSAGGISISAKRCKILAQSIIYLKD